MKHDHSKWLRHCDETFRETRDESEDSQMEFYKKLTLEAGMGCLSPIAILTGKLSGSSVSLSADQQSSDDESSASSENVAKESVNCADVSAVAGRKTAFKPKPEKIIMPTAAQFPSHENGSKQATGGQHFSVAGDEDEDPISEREILHSSTDPGLSLEEFIQYMNTKGRKGLYEEYNMIKSKPVEGTFECARLRENQLKNRYTDVLCYDHSRVRLSPGDAADETDYINAN